MWRDDWGEVGRRWFAVLITVAVGFAVATEPVVAGDSPSTEHDGTFRPSVLIRQGKSLGSGTIIASVEGETLILTASHVVDGPEAVSVEIHRFNLGLERTQSKAGFPRRLAATVVARDADADLAILEIRDELAFPYVARLAPGDGTPADGTKVVTIGFDKGERLIGFSTRIRSAEKLDMGHGGGERSFLITEDPPEHGRSGGGLFRSDGALVGVCVARAEMDKGRKLGLFASLSHVKSMIQADEEITATIGRSGRRARSPAR